MAVKSEAQLKTGQIVKHQAVAELEERFDSRIDNNADKASKLAAVTQTFDEVILRDQHFSSLL